MESLIKLFGICFGVFFLFSISEVIKMKKSINRLDGIVKYLLKQEKIKKENK